jgi:hypothetical protein
MSAPGSLQNVSFSAGDAVNATTEAWRFEPLKSNFTFANGTLEGAINGTINGTTIINTLSSTTVGSIQLASFIYIIMSVVIIVMLLPCSVKWIQAASGGGHRFVPLVAMPEFPERIFKSQLRRYYPPLPDAKPIDSYAEAVDHTPTGVVTPEELRKCRKLLRGKYSLDCQIFNLRHVYEPNRHIVENMKRRSDGACSDLHRMVSGWKQARDQWSAEERKLLTEISERISSIKPKYLSDSSET